MYLVRRHDRAFSLLLPIDELIVGTIQRLARTQSNTMYELAANLLHGKSQQQHSSQHELPAAVSRTLTYWLVHIYDSSVCIHTIQKHTAQWGTFFTPCSLDSGRVIALVKEVHVCE